MPSDNDFRSGYQEDTGSKTIRKMKENPMVPIGMVGFFVAVAYGIRNFKNRPKNMSASMYVMRFRVFAQSIAVGAMGIGIGYTILQEKFFKSSTDQDNEKKKR